MVSRPGERGRTGDHGQNGQQGEQGEQGIQGERGRSLTWWQALVMFLLVVGVVLLLSWRSENQQRQIRENTDAIVQANYERCLGGVIILSRFNAQQDALATIERNLAAQPEVSEAGKEAATARVKAYEGARVLPLPTCVR